MILIIVQVLLMEYCHEYMELFPTSISVKLGVNGVSMGKARFHVALGNYDFLCCTGSAFFVSTYSNGFQVFVSVESLIFLYSNIPKRIDSFENLKRTDICGNMI